MNNPLIISLEYSLISILLSFFFSIFISLKKEIIKNNLNKKYFNLLSFFAFLLIFIFALTNAFLIYLKHYNDALNFNIFIIILIIIIDLLEGVAYWEIQRIKSDSKIRFNNSNKHKIYILIKKISRIKILNIIFNIYLFFIFAFLIFLSYSLTFNFIKIKQILIWSFILLFTLLIIISFWFFLTFYECTTKIKIKKITDNYKFFKSNEKEKFHLILYLYKIISEKNSKTIKLIEEYEKTKSQIKKEKITTLLKGYFFENIEYSDLEYSILTNDYVYLNKGINVYKNNYMHNWILFKKFKNKSKIKRQIYKLENEMLRNNNECDVLIIYIYIKNKKIYEKYILKRNKRSLNLFLKKYAK